MMRQRSALLGVLSAVGLLAAAIAVACVNPGILHAAAAAAATPAGVLTASIFFPWKPAKSAQDLKEIAFPELASQPEVIPHIFYDTQSLATASSAPLNFFVNTNNDRTISNMDSAGQLPDPQYFEVYYVACDILQVPTATALAGEPNAALANVENILKTCRATFEITLASKSMGVEPLMACHSLGGATFSGYGYGTAANGTSSGVVNNGIPGTGGFPYNGALVIPPKNAFKLQIAFGAASTLVGGPINIRMSLVGNWYRRVS
jgi:hypothetical protein